MHFTLPKWLRSRQIISFAVLSCGPICGSAMAVPVNDPIGDFNSTFTGPKNGDLDVTRSEATFDGAVFRLDATVNGAIGTTTTGVYVWGFNRGLGIADFAPIGAPNVKFDAVVIVNPGAGVVTVVDIAHGTTTTLPASVIKVSGNKISVEIPANLLSPQGFEQAKFLASLWPSSGNGALDTIADFSPSNATARLTLAFPTPEEASVQTEVVFDDASDRFARIQRRLDAQHEGGDGSRIGGFLDLGARFGARGLGNSLAGHHVSRITAAGIDYALNPSTAIGFGFAADRTHSDLASGGSLKTNVYSPEVYFSYRSSGFRFDGYAAYSIVKYRSRRLLAIGASLLPATAQPKGHAFSFGVSAGYDIGVGGLLFTPGIDLLTTRTHVGAYDEENEQDFGSALAGRNRTSARLGLGAAVKYIKTSEWGTAAFHGKARYVTELGDRRDAIAFAYTAEPDLTLSLVGPKTGVDYVAIELGADVTTHHGLRMGVSYTPRIDGGGFVDHTAVLQLSKEL